MRMRAGESFDGVTRLWPKLYRRRHFLIFAAALGAVVAVWFLRGYLTDIDWTALGYPGVFVLSFVGSVAMVLPVPGLISVCGISVVLNPFIVGLLAGVGETLGEISGYAVGYGGRGVVAERPFYKKVEAWMERRGTLTLFVMSIIPNPVFDVVGIAAGATRFPLRRFFATVWAGKTLKGLLVAYTCFYGFRLLPWVD